MPQIVVGIDLGSTSIKITRLETSLFRFDFKETTEHLLPAHTDLPWEERAVQALRALFPEQAASGYKVVASFPGRYVSSRILSMPFSDKKKIEQTLPFELEGLIPFPIEDVVIDYQVLETNSSGSKVLAICAHKGTLDAHLKIYKTSGIDPQVLIPPSVSLANLSKLIQGESPEPILIIDVGDTETALSLVSHGRLTFCRTLMIGSSSLATQLEHTLGISHERAQELLEHEADLSVVEPQLEDRTTDDVVRILSSSLQPLVRGISQTLASTHDAIQITPQRIYLCGTGASLNGLSTYLSRHLDIDVFRLEFQSGPGSSAPLYECNPLSGANSIGLALHAIRDHTASSLNLRTGEFAYVSSLKALRTTAVSFGVMVSTLLVLLVINFGLKYHYKSAEHKRLQAAITKVATEISPDIKGLQSDKQKLSALASKLDEDKRALGLFAAISPNSLSVLDVLLALTEAVPQDTTIDVRELVIEGDKVRVQGETTSSNTAEQIKNNLLKKEMFANAEIMDVKPSVDRSTVKFQMNLDLRSKAF